MKWPKIEILLTVLTILLLSCNRSDRNSDLVKFLKITEDKWITELQELGFDKGKNLKNTILLVTSSTHCPDCLGELSVWNEINQREHKDFKIILVVIERYTSRYKNFLARNGLSISSLQDRSALAIEEELIPFVPVKIYFDPSGTARRMHIIGSDDAFANFLKEVQSNNDGSLFLDDYLNLENQ